MLDDIFLKTGLTVSAGLSTSRFKAKMTLEKCTRPSGGVACLNPNDYDGFLGSR